MAATTRSKCAGMFGVLCGGRAAADAESPYFAATRPRKRLLAVGAFLPR